jgi:hypothetical protein
LSGFQNNAKYLKKGRTKGERRGYREEDTVHSRSKLAVFREEAA